MKITTLAFLAIISFMVGCSTTTVKTYSADFKVYPVKTDGLGETISLADGQKYEIKQKYTVEAVITETETTNGEMTTRVVSTPIALFPIGKDAIAHIGNIEEKGSGGGLFEVKSSELESEYHFDIKFTFKEPCGEPVTCAQAVTVKK